MDFQIDQILEFVEQELNKQNERLRLQKSREEEQRKPAKMSDKQEFEEERQIDWGEDEYLKDYFKREKAVLWNIYGEEWRKYLRHPDLPRKKYYVEERRRDSSDERKRQAELQARSKKKKGGSIFRKYD